MIMNTLDVGTTNHIPNLEDHRTFDDARLDAVTGGVPSASVGVFGYMIHIPMGVPYPPSTKPAK
jgi:hypothetical protein